MAEDGDQPAPEEPVRRAGTRLPGPGDADSGAGDEGAGYDVDVVVVGSGFGGAVAALRLTEKGYRVLVLEAGRRFTPQTLPRTSWDLRSYLWAPALGCFGIQRVHLLRDVLVLAGAGVGGGSLNYGNTLYVPPKSFFEDPQWRRITDWEGELRPYYDQAERMLGVRENPSRTASDQHLRAVAERMGVGGTFRATPVGVFFGDGGDGPGTSTAPAGGEVPDPYFGGAGPRRRACTECGECMTGCRHGAKNTLLENYLHLAERGGARVVPMSTVHRISPLDPGRPDQEGFAVHTHRSGSRGRRRRESERRITTRQVVVAAGTYGTQSLLHAMRDGGQLPGIPARLGHLTRTNSEAVVGATAPSRVLRRGVDYTRGVAITASIHPDPDTHIEVVRYGKGSNAMGLLSTLQVPGGGRLPRWSRYLGAMAAQPVAAARSLSNRRWSERTVIGLVMQSLDNSIVVERGRRGLAKGRLTSRQGHGQPNPTWLPTADRAAKLLAEEIGGFPGSSVGEVLNRPMTAHFLGGCPISDSPDTGVVDPYHRLYGHPGISVVDGSAISANLGVNPSLTITAQAERAMALWPNLGESDPRPAPGDPYRRIAPVAPHTPVVPAEAFGALRLPVLLPVPEVPRSTDAP